MYYLLTYLSTHPPTHPPTFLPKCTHTHTYILHKLHMMHEVMYTQLLGTVYTCYAFFKPGIMEPSHANVVSNCIRLSAWIHFLLCVCVCVCVCVCARARVRACGTIPAKANLRHSNLTHREPKCYLERDWLHFVLPLTHLPLLCEYFWLCSLRTQQIRRWTTPQLMQVSHHFRLLTQTLCILLACPPMFAVNNYNDDDNDNNNNCIVANNNNQWIWLSYHCLETDVYWEFV